MREILIPLMPIVMIVLGVVLSIAAFHGGFHFATLRYLKKMQKLNDYAFNGNDLQLKKEFNDFYTEMSVEKNKADFSDFLKFGLFHDKKSKP